MSRTQLPVRETEQRRQARGRKVGAALALMLTVACPPLMAETAVPQAPVSSAGEGEALSVRVGYVGRRYPEPEPLSLVDKVVIDQGIQGARIALDEDNRTGRLIRHEYSLTEKLVAAQESPGAAAVELLRSGVKLIVADLEAADLLELADMPEAKDAIILDVRTMDDSTRGADCRGNVFHVRPSRAMKADALAQYLVWKRWQRWLLVVGTKPNDIAFAAAIRRAAGRFGARIVDERSYTFQAGSRRTDTGHQQIQTQMPLVTQGAAAHDVIIVADEDETFGEYVMFRSSEPRPVAGTHGLIATAWHRSFEEYAATQMQNRFERRANRFMTERDYAGWLAVRIIGEAVTRIGRADAPAIRDYLRSPAFEVAGFKGLGLDFRTWDQQLRQPVLIAGPRAMVSISPQEGFLHQRHTLDSLGIDENESKCRIDKSTQ